MQVFPILRFWGVLSLFIVLAFAPIPTRPAENLYPPVIPEEDISRDEAMEQALLDLVNQLRADPPRFYRQVVEPYLRQETAIHVTAKYVNSLRKEILHCPPLPSFRSDDRLRRTAFLLANDIVNHQHGRLSHTMSNGMDFAARFRQAGIACGAENLYTGLNRTPEEVLADWLIDEGVPDFGHRHNLLNPQYRSTGIVVLRNKAGQIWVVEDFGCEP
ncbi:CAP domain-containing protein [Thermoflavifilum thermophilum]|uniref:Cysteine-rich secretory protein family protein n=1 Tax=Thermoflavifilum thermophilum TaxID=1393122 RepID=A0A1I7NAQ4_9BACT|nr:CAP domain-containing protein [Thermoflavifilum thermophilum]SFV31745.1 Cysteine-rich secretory protein family protein [Thermoflavifilum thermophilum]